VARGKSNMLEIFASYATAVLLADFPVVIAQQCDADNFHLFISDAKA
jgi:hypothetical protein